MILRALHARRFRRYRRARFIALSDTIALSISALADAAVLDFKRQLETRAASPRAGARRRLPALMTRRQIDDASAATCRLTKCRAALLIEAPATAASLLLGFRLCHALSRRETSGRRWRSAACAAPTRTLSVAAPPGLGRRAAILPSSADFQRRLETDSQFLAGSMIACAGRPAGRCHD